MNTLKTGILLAALTALFLFAGYALAGEGGMLMALAVAGAMNLFAFWNADKLMLRMHGAREVDAKTAPELVGIVADLAQRADMPMPKVYIMQQDQPNAFATGRSPNRAAVAATTGLLRLLDRAEIRGVMAHELAHIRNRDTLIMTVTATIAGALGFLANYALWFGAMARDSRSPLGPLAAILMAILAPLAAALVQMAISRGREYEADRIGAEIAGDPRALASALHKLAHGAAKIDNDVAENNPATAHLFIVNPLHARSVDGLFSTHPPTDRRIERLLEMAGPNPTPPRPSPPRQTPPAGWGRPRPARRRGSVPPVGRG